MTASIDHLVYATPDVGATVDEIERALGVRPALGGRHVGAGTYNMLASLGGSTYLEVIGPDPDQPSPEGPRPFGVDDLTAPRLVGWALAATGIDASIERARARGYDTGPAAPMRRERPDGVLLSWRLTLNGIAGGPIPFLIDWGDTEHPSTTSPGGLRLVGFRIEHPDPSSIEPALRALDAEIPVTTAAEEALVATIEGPGGRIDLR